MDRLERIWMVGNGVAYLAIACALYVYGVSRKNGPPDIDGVTAIYPSVILGGLISLFAVFIPTRVAINLAPSRRRRFRETVVLILTFVALGAMFVAMFTHTEPG